jgi:hypothetical protein
MTKALFDKFTIPLSSLDQAEMKSFICHIHQFFLNLAASDSRDNNQLLGYSKLAATDKCQQIYLAYEAAVYVADDGDGKENDNNDMGNDDNIDSNEDTDDNNDSKLGIKSQWSSVMAASSSSDTDSNDRSKRVSNHNTTKVAGYHNSRSATMLSEEEGGEEEDTKAHAQKVELDECCPNDAIHFTAILLDEQYWSQVTVMLSNIKDHEYQSHSTP